MFFFQFARSGYGSGAVLELVIFRLVVIFFSLGKWIWKLLLLTSECTVQCDLSTQPNINNEFTLDTSDNSAGIHHRHLKPCSKATWNFLQIYTLCHLINPCRRYSSFISLYFALSQSNGSFTLVISDNINTHGAEHWRDTTIDILVIVKYGKTKIFFICSCNLFCLTDRFSVYSNYSQNNFQLPRTIVTSDDTWRNYFN